MFIWMRVCLPCDNASNNQRFNIAKFYKSPPRIFYLFYFIPELPERDRSEFEKFPPPEAPNKLAVQNVM